MATADHDSSFDLDVGSMGNRGDGGAAGQQIWLDGDVLACACPDCGAPMSIRLWLLVADCWRCGASIELTDEQEREALRLLREQEASRQAETRAAAAAITPTMRPVPKPTPPAPAESKPEPAVAAPPTSPKPEPAPKAAPALPPALPQGPPRRREAAQVPRGARARIREIHEKGSIGIFWRDLFKDLPAWLVSLIVHLVAILLLGLWMIAPPRETETITLATAVGYEDISGDTDLVEEVDPEAFEFEKPGGPEDALAMSDTLGKLDAPLKPDPIMPSEMLGMLDEVSELTRTLPSTAGGSMFAGRDPRVRDQLVRSQGGTSQTEAAVTRGLEWLARHQNGDGSWSLDAWDRAPRATGGHDGLGGHSDTAGTAMALLPFLGAGQTHLNGQYRDEVFKGLRWLRYAQKEDGDLRGQGIGRMYAHGQATIALCEAYALTSDDELREAAQRGLDFIVKAQHKAGGWRYQPGEAGDTSVVGWQLMALRSGKMAYLIVPDETFSRADRYLDAAATDRYRGRYAYQPGSGESFVMTAEALLCRQYLGWPRDHHQLNNGVRWLLEEHPPTKRSPDIYYWYYATQVMHHMGGEVWNRWNASMRNVLVEMQRTEGPMSGSWDPVGPHAGRGGRIYMTALAICTLEVYYRHLPMYRPDIVKEYRSPQGEPQNEAIGLEASK